METLQKAARKRIGPENAMRCNYTTNLIATYCPKTYRDLGPTNRHSYKKPRCAYVEENILFIDWEEVWGDICAEMP